MKTLPQKQLLLLLTFLLFSRTILAQVPQQFNYQGAARNPGGSPIPNRQISLRLSVISGTPAGETQYTETRKVTTSPLGLYAVQIGSPGAATHTGSIATVSWGQDDKYLKVEIDPYGGSNFSAVATTQLLSVPYALYAANGPAGEKGDQGEPGLDGKDGKDGLPGPKGDAGEKGEPGAPGTNGIDGKDGKDGIPGPKGDRGDKGDAGEKGAPGVPGTNGIDGKDGKDGSPGPKGDKGDTGEKGAQGPAGPGVTDPKNILSSELDIQGGEGSTLNEVILAIKPAAVTNAKLANGAVSPEKILPGGHNQLLSTDESGKVTWTDKPLAAKAGSWNDVATQLPASDNQQNIYQKGKVGILTPQPVASLDVRGAVRFGNPDLNAVIGSNTAAFGNSNMATADNAMAFGQSNKVQGINAASFGMRNTASGTMATTFGTDNTASGSRATVFGTLSEVSGHYSTSFGTTNKVIAFGSTVMGGNLQSSSDFQTLIGIGNAITTGNETILQVGIGDQNRPEIRANALTVLKNGFTGIGSSKAAPNSTLQVFGSLSTAIRIAASGTLAAEDHTVLLRGSVQMPAAEEKNKGRIYHLVLDTQAEVSISGSLRLAGVNISSIILDGTPGSRAIAVQSDGQDWVLISQL